MALPQQRSPRTFASRDGLDIAYHEWGAEQPGAPVVLHHGFPSSAEVGWVLTGVVDDLVTHGRRVVAIDMRGCSESSKPHESRYYSLELLAGDVSSLVDALGVPAVDLVGYSLGALVALLVATEESRIRRLVVGGVGAGVLDLGRSTTRLVPRSMEAAVAAPDMGSLTDPREIATRAIAEASRADLAAMRLLARATRAEPIPLHRISAPTLVAVGQGDGLARGAEKVVAAIPDARILRVDSDHVGTLRSPEFLSGILGYTSESDGRVET